MNSASRISPLRFPGGKSKVAKKIVSLFPEFDEYREPFLGGGSIFFAAKQRFPDKRFWINDIDFNIFIFWKILQINPQGLVEKSKFFKEKYSENGKELFHYLKKNLSESDDVAKAAIFFVLNRISFSGMYSVGGYSHSAFEKRFKNAHIEKLFLSTNFLKDVRITCLPYEEIFKEEGKNVFLFLDPPYYSTKKSRLYGEKGKYHAEFDHEKLASILKTTSFKWLMTCDDSPYIKNLYSFASIKEMPVTYGMRNQSPRSSQKAIELIITNY